MNRSIRGFTLSIIAIVLDIIATIVLFTTDFRMGAGQSEGMLILIMGIAATVGSLIALVDFVKTKEKTGLRAAGLSVAVPALIGALIMIICGLGGSGFLEM